MFASAGDESRKLWVVSDPMGREKRRAVVQCSALLDAERNIAELAEVLEILEVSDGRWPLSNGRKRVYALGQRESAPENGRFGLCLRCDLAGSRENGFDCRAMLFESFPKFVPASGHGDDADEPDGVSPI